ncbi:hypothetical protein ES703_27611 [subsurface metagenome]
MMLQCAIHRTTRDTDSNAIRTQLSFPMSGQCALYTFRDEDLELFQKAGDESIIGLCKIKRL